MSPLGAVANLAVKRLPYKTGAEKGTQLSIKTMETG